jgi:hypothetical protein
MYSRHAGRADEREAETARFGVPTWLPRPRGTGNVAGLESVSGRRPCGQASDLGQAFWAFALSRKAVRSLITRRCEGGDNVEPLSGLLLRIEARLIERAAWSLSLRWFGGRCGASYRSQEIGKAFCSR